jgi:hypothetical protein
VWSPVWLRYLPIEGTAGYSHGDPKCATDREGGVAEENIVMMHWEMLSLLKQKTYGFHWADGLVLRPGPDNDWGTEASLPISFG